MAEQFAAFTPYHYVHNNPIIMIDPDGMNAEFVWEEDENGNMQRVGEGQGGIYDSETEHRYHYKNGDFAYVDMVDGEKSYYLTSEQIEARNNYESPNLWNSTIARAYVKDVYSVSFGGSFVPGIGSGHSVEVTLVTRGEEPGVAVTTSPSLNVGVEQGAIISTSVSVGFSYTQFYIGKGRTYILWSTKF